MSNTAAVLVGLPGMSNTAAVLLGLVLAGACLVVWLIRTRRVEPAKGQRGRLRKLGWCAALLVLSVIVVSSLSSLPMPGNLSSWWLAMPVVAALIIIICWPHIAGRIVPVALIFYGLFGFVVARDYAFGGINSYGLTAVGNSSFQADLILPQAYAILLLGGWLMLRSADPVLVRARRWLGPVARAPLGYQLRALALVPVVAVLAGLLAPRLWLAGGAALILTPLLLFGVLLVIRRWPVRAAQLATAGLLCAGIAGLVIAAAWRSGSYVISEQCFSSLQPVPSSTAASAQPVPAPAASAQPKKPSFVPPAKPVKPAYSKPVCRPAPLFIGGGTAADIGDVVWGQALPYGSVLVDSQHTADAAGVEGLALLALGTWLAPQAFPRVRRMLGGTPDAELTKRVERLTESRAVAVDTASADLRRLERDLHDGAQARLVALGMNLRAAERLIATSPEAAIALVAEARKTSVMALMELRELVRGVLPPVLADRGLADAIRALALDSPLHVETDIDLPGRLPAPLETACYFAVAELLTNAAKHSGAREARIAISHSGRLLRIEVTDFGLGGADPEKGSGMAGVERRMATFDGILAVSSPVGGPTMVVMEVPCVLSSPRTSSS
ncbi:MAG TPA: histidine kinase [Streptosporangiaceae bacterium]